MSMPKGSFPCQKILNSQNPRKVGTQKGKYRPEPQAKDLGRLSNNKKLKVPNNLWPPG